MRNKIDKLLYSVNKRRKFFFNFAFPNRVVLKQNRIKINLHSKTDFNQKTFITGLGNVQIGSKCMFGYELGGVFPRRIYRITTTI